MITKLAVWPATSSDASPPIGRVNSGEVWPFGRLGVVYVRHGNAMAGSAPKQRSVLSVFGWATECLEEWLTEIRPVLARAGSRALWPTERGGRVSETRTDDHFGVVRRELSLPAGDLNFHGLRRSYVTHLIEDGFDPRFVQEQVGHEHGFNDVSLHLGVIGLPDQIAAPALDRAVSPLGLDIGVRNKARKEVTVVAKRFTWRLQVRMHP